MSCIPFCAGPSANSSFSTATRRSDSRAPSCGVCVRRGRGRGLRDAGGRSGCREPDPALATPPHAAPPPPGCKPPQVRGTRCPLPRDRALPPARRAHLLQVLRFNRHLLLHLGLLLACCSGAQRNSGGAVPPLRRWGGRELRWPVAAAQLWARTHAVPLSRGGATQRRWGRCAGTGGAIKPQLAAMPRALHAPIASPHPLCVRWGIPRVGLHCWPWARQASLATCC